MRRLGIIISSLEEYLVQDGQCGQRGTIHDYYCNAVYGKKSAVALAF
jgi:hypothetical protein